MAAPGVSEAVDVGGDGGGVGGALLFDGVVPLGAEFGEGGGGLDFVAHPLVEGVEDEEGGGGGDDAVGAAEGEEFVGVVVGARGEGFGAGGGPGGGEDGAGAGGVAGEGHGVEGASADDGGDGGFGGGEFAEDADAALVVAADALDGGDAVAVEGIEDVGGEDGGANGVFGGLDLEVDEAAAAGLAEEFAVGVGLGDDGDYAAEFTGSGAGEGVDAVGEEEGEVDASLVRWNVRDAGEVGTAVVVEFFEVGDQGVAVGKVDGGLVRVAEDVEGESRGGGEASGGEGGKEGVFAVVVGGDSGGRGVPKD